MSLMNALLKTYDYALDRGLVDNPSLSQAGLTLLPIYHSSKKASSNEEIFELWIDKNSNAIGGDFLNKDQLVVFPITEDSITRSGSKIAPHAISDELSYLASTLNTDKNKAYLEGIHALVDYEKENSNENFKIMGEYILKNQILEDFLKFYLGNTEYEIGKKSMLKYKAIDNKGQEKEKQINLEKVFITFRLEKEETADMTLTRDVDLHKFYIHYIQYKNSHSKELYYCDISGILSYCTERHRGIMGNAKLISISNNDETYYGRFRKGDEVYHVSYESSQKVHNMLKYLLEHPNHRKYIGESAYVINWLDTHLDRGGLDLLSEFTDDDDDEFDNDDDCSMEELGGSGSKGLGKYFFGEDGSFSSEGDFYVLILEKISNGRVSIKYFRQLSKAEGHERIKKWYESTSWNFYKTEKSPSLYQIVNFVYGDENKQGFLSCENKKLSRSTIERLVPSIIDSKKLARDIPKTAFYRLSNKQSYKKSWNTALGIGCSLIKKHKYDYENYVIDANHIGEVKQMKESRSFYYGRLLAIYEKVELDATGSRVGTSSKGDKSATVRVTNSDRLWNSFIRTPERTRLILETKLRPYFNMLKKVRPGSYVFYDRLITGISTEIARLNESGDCQTGSLNEDFILGYYYQKDSFYKKNDTESKNEEE